MKRYVRKFKEEEKRIVNKSDSREDIARSSTRLIFKSQELLDLWKNELMGQISDGAWENAKGTEWLWYNSSAQLGNENIVKVDNLYNVKKKNYAFFKELFGVIGDRMMVNNGFDSPEELKKACLTISQMIANPVEDSSIYQDIQKYTKNKELERISALNNIINSYKDLVNWDTNYEFTLGEFKLNSYNVYRNFKVGYSPESDSYSLTIKDFNKKISIVNRFKIKDFPNIVKILTDLDNIGK